MRRYAYGRLPAVHTRQTLRGALFMAAALDPLGPAPSVCNDYLAARGTLAPQMWDNDKIGDCVCVDTANRLVLRTANVSTALVPTTAQVIDLYTKFGYVIGNETTDNGVDLTTICNYLISTGFLGHKALGVANVEPSNFDHVLWSIQLFGGCRLGLNLPGYAEDQFDTNETWDVSSIGDQSTEGHDVAAVDFKGNNLIYVDTWGKTIPMTRAAFSTWCDEVKIELYPDWIRAQGEAPSGIDLNGLVALLKSIT